MSDFPSITEVAEGWVTSEQGAKQIVSMAAGIVEETAINLGLGEEEARTAGRMAAAEILGRATAEEAWELVQAIRVLRFTLQAWPGVEALLRQAELERPGLIKEGAINPGEMRLPPPPGPLGEASQIAHGRTFSRHEQCHGGAGCFWIRYHAGGNSRGGAGRA